jgi:Transposase DDE domain
MVLQDSVLVALVRLVDRIPMPATAQASRLRGRPRVYPDRLFLKALVIMIVRHLPKVHSLLAVVAEPTPQMRELRELLTEQGRFPSRRTFERRLKAIPETLPAQIACLGSYLVELIKPWPESGRAAAIDSTVLRAQGGVWHRKHREAGVVPHSSIDTEAHWTKSGWHGWVYGWKLHLVTTVAAVWIPLAADLTPANRADNEQAPALLAKLPTEVRFILGDVHYNDPALVKLSEEADRLLVTTKRGPYPHQDDGVEVRRLFHKLRSRAIENFNEQFKAIFDCHGQVPTKGLLATRRFVLGAVLVYQLTLLHRFEAKADLRVGLKPFLQAA